MVQFKIIDGKLGGGMKICLYGVEGIGKTTLASKFPSPLFIDTEGSTKFINVRRLEPPTSWQMLMEQVKYVRDHRELLRTLVIDTLDMAEKLCIRHVCNKFQKDGLESFDYGKGYTFVHEEFGKLLNLLTEVTEKGVSVVVTAHASTKRREQPEEFGSYDVWSLNLIDTPKCSNSNMVRSWADLVLFANYKTFVVAADEKGKKHKAQGGQRVMYTTHHPCWDAKNRLGLPAEIPLEFEPLAPWFSAGAPEAKPPVPDTPQAGTQMSLPLTGKPDTSPAAPNPTSAAQKTEAVPSDSPTPTTGTQDHIPENLTTVSQEVPKELRSLMISAQVTEEEVREVIRIRQPGVFPIGTPWSVMDKAGFVNGWVIPFWDKIVEMIRENPDRIPF